MPCFEESTDPGVTPPPGPPPAQNGVGDDDRDRKFETLRSNFAKEVTGERERREAAEAKIKEYETAQAAAEQKRLEKQGEFKTLAEQKSAEAADWQARAEAAEAKDAARLEAVAASNTERLKALPETLRKFPLSQDADQAAAQLAALEGQVKTAPPGGVWNDPARPAGNPPTAEQEIEALTRNAQQAQLGRRKSTTKGVIK